MRKIVQTVYNREPRMDPCGTPDVTGSHSDAHPFNTSSCFPFHQ